MNIRRVLQGLRLNRTPGWHFPAHYLGLYFGSLDEEQVEVAMPLDSPGIDAQGHVVPAALRGRTGNEVRLATVSMGLNFASLQVQDTLRAQRLQVQGLRHRHADRYTRLEDAVAYARLVHSRASLNLPEDRMTSPNHREDAKAASEAELDEMRRLGVEHRNGRYTFGEFKYDKLSDALAYARLKARDQESAAAGDGHQRTNATDPKR